jgi:hypothetical protein
VEQVSLLLSQGQQLTLVAVVAEADVKRTVSYAVPVVQVAAVQEDTATKAAVEDSSACLTPVVVVAVVVAKPTMHSLDGVVKVEAAPLSSDTILQQGQEITR